MLNVNDIEKYCFYIHTSPNLRKKMITSDKIHNSLFPTIASIITLICMILILINSIILWNDWNDLCLYTFQVSSTLTSVDNIIHRN